MEDIDRELRTLIESVPESIFSGLLGSDGLPVFMYSKENLEKSEISAELAAIFNSTKRSIKSLEFGRFLEVFISTDKFVIILSPLGEEYFVALGMRAPANLGKARLELRRVIPRVEEMMK